MSAQGGDVNVSVCGNEPLTRSKPYFTGARWVSGLLLIAMVLSWSSGFIGYRYVSEAGGVMLATFWRFVLAVLLLLPLVWTRLRLLSWRNWVDQSVVGLLGIAGYIAPIAQSIALGVAPGTSSLLANLLPLSIVLLAGFVPGQATRGWQWLGVMLCLVGMLIASGSSLEFSRASVWAYSLPLLAVASLAMATIYQKQSRHPPLPGLLGLFVQACVALPVFAVLAWQEGSLRPVMTAGFGFGVLWLVVFSTLGGYGFYWLCLHRFTLQSISGALFLTPPVTMIWAYLQFDDPLAMSALLGVALTLAGLPFLRRRAVQVEVRV
ncbi:DMT family transporter [Pseudomonas sp. DWP3-1-2]|uniref:DMT family transporter n=1 Tax=Pseudomonas sp. DWP3-1-2 TaxID=2804645 RepID=UPI003CE6B90E